MRYGIRSIKSAIRKTVNRNEPCIIDGVCSYNSPCGTNHCIVGWMLYEDEDFKSMLADGSHIADNNSSVTSLFFEGSPLQLITYKTHLKLNSLDGMLGLLESLQNIHDQTVEGMSKTYTLHRYNEILKEYDISPVIMKNL